MVTKSHINIVRNSEIHNMTELKKSCSNSHMVTQLKFLMSETHSHIHSLTNTVLHEQSPKVIKLYSYKLTVTVTKSHSKNITVIRSQS